MKPKRLDCLEGVRALACLGVFICHFQNGFFPNSSAAQALFKTPLYFMFSGNTAVRVMFALSGFVLCYKYFRTENYKDIEQDALKRYLRLMLPTLAVTLLVYVMMRLGLLWNAEAAAYTGSQEFMGLFNQFEPDLKNSIREGLWDSLFKGASSYVGPLWTMEYEMLGSYFILAAAALLKSKRVRYLFCLLYVLIFSNYYAYFVLGMLICHIYTHEEKVNLFFEKHRSLSLVLHVLSWCYIGMITNLDVFKWRSLLFDLSLLLMFLTLLNSPVLNRIWGNKAGVALGKHSFSVYLLHWPVIESFSCGLFLLMLKKGFGLTGVILIDFVLTLAALMILSAAFTYGVVLPAARLSNQAAKLIQNGFTGKRIPKAKE